MMIRQWPLLSLLLSSLILADDAFAQGPADGSTEATGRSTH